MVLSTEDAEAELDAFEYFCSTLTLQQKVPMVLETFQRTMLADFFAGVVENVIITPKKNYKSTTIAAVGLYHALVTDNADCVVLAASVEQAKYIFRHMRGFIARSPELQKHFDVKPGFNEIRSRRDLGRIRVFAADADTLEGVEPTLGIIDEYGKHRSGEVYQIISDGLGTREGQMIVISNAPSDEDTPLGELRGNAYKYLVKRQGAHRYCRKDDGSFAFHEWALDPDEDWEDLLVVKTANPAAAQTLAELKRRRGSPQMTDGRWKRMACGLTVRDGDGLITPDEWDALFEEGLLIPEGSPVYIGMDLAWIGPDTTALTPIWWQSETRRVIGDPVVIEPPGDGSLLDDRLILKALLDFNERFDIRGVVFDPNAGAQQFVQATKRDHRIPFVHHSTKPQALALADGRFLEAVRRRELVHNGNKTLRAHVLNAVERAVGDGFMFGRPKGKRVPIDALTAVSMAHSSQFAEHTTPKRTGAYFFSPSLV